MKKVLVLLIGLTSFQLIAQTQKADPQNYDKVYRSSIKSVKFHLNGLFLSQPIIDLNSGSVLRLSFDDLDTEVDVKDFVYTIEHCDRDWKPSKLNEMEFLDGFNGELIENFRYSFKTTVDYTHYELTLPNQDIRWTKSGNYLLKVYEDIDDKPLVIVRRFMVVDRQVSIAPQMVPGQGSRFQTHQEIDFAVDLQQLRPRSAQQELTAVILQNGRWDNAIGEIRPLFERQNRAIFDYQNKIVFPAGKEFRYIDLRSLNYRGDGVAVIEEYSDGYEIVLEKEEKRFNKVYLSMDDLNGNFVIENADQPNPQLSSDYANVLFALYSPEPLYDYNVYLFGAMTDWQLRDDYKMVYNNSVNSYVAKVMLKQGFYNYSYVVVNEDEPTPNMTEIEGDWYETENNYTILIYYRPFGERYDQLIGAVTVSSRL